MDKKCFIILPIIILFIIIFLILIDIFYFNPRIINNEHSDWYHYCALIVNSVFGSIAAFLFIIFICLIIQFYGFCNNERISIVLV